jgi:hypothetical protein
MRNKRQKKRPFSRLSFVHGGRKKKWDAAEDCELNVSPRFHLRTIFVWGFSSTAASYRQGKLSTRFVKSEDKTSQKVL